MGGSEEAGRLSSKPSRERGRLRRKTDHTLEGAIEKWGAMVFRLAFAYCGNEHDAGDAFQNAFLKRHLCREPFADAEHEKAWLIRVTINCANDILRRRGVRVAEPIEGPAASAQVARDSLGAYELKKSADERSQALEQALSALSPKQRAAVHLFYYEGYSTAEIAEITGDAPATVRSHLHRARKALHIELEDAQ